MGKIIPNEKSIIVTCDVITLADLTKIVRQTDSVEGIGGYKVGAILVIQNSLPEVVNRARRDTQKPIIYDHQKAMTDTPHLGSQFVEVVKRSGVDALIGFPESGPATEETWINECKNAGLNVIIGGEMTHQSYKRSEGGYICDDAMDEMYLRAARLGVSDFFVPGNKTNRIQHYLEILQPIVGEQICFFATGFGAQGGIIPDAAKVAGQSFHAAVGREICNAGNMHDAAVEMVSQLRK